jgi:proteasome lid subunit RPN8/RPN11
MGILYVPRDVRARLEAWVRAGYPEETCGLLIGRHAAGQPRVVRAAQVSNLSRSRAQDRYELDPDGFVAVDESARVEGLEIVGTWHSHPDHPACPSQTDRAMAWEGWSYLIAAVTAQGVTELRSWRLVDGRFEEETIET